MIDDRPGMVTNFQPAKLSRPRLKRVYPRKRLFNALSDVSDFGAVWITGPAGSGKTTAVNSFLKERRLPCLWYSLDEGDTDIASFFHYLGWAVAAHSPAGAALPPVLQAVHAIKSASRGGGGATSAGSATAATSSPR